MISRPCAIGQKRVVEIFTLPKLVELTDHFPDRLLLKFPIQRALGKGQDMRWPIWSPRDGFHQGLVIMSTSGFTPAPGLVVKSAQANMFHHHSLPQLTTKIIVQIGDG